jgi:hypothetical protein
MRRALPVGMAMPEYTFREGPADLNPNDPADFSAVRLADLFTDGHDTLIVDHFMYGAGGAVTVGGAVATGGAVVGAAATPAKRITWPFCSSIDPVATKRLPALSKAMPFGQMRETRPGFGIGEFAAMMPVGPVAIERRAKAPPCAILSPHAVQRVPAVLSP